ncbi:DHA2 family efflux MFS transporter permease subunit [Amorphoplanes digitatis]|uniref:EmrB/QacA subfamily drug resistance transporter n=1 Tax=Actinoplanes digitatis TaxID=1868 RepID=A0A7W7HZ31_9ACTN|nr:MDR family MFS transporter [Actinoplanes digitatis]MBB4763308.1 EmrB/QacA subfamily drug resistance transporter [Actinoplanes digitatis]
MATGDTAIVVSRRQANLVFVAILLGTLVAALDQTIVTTALATIVSDLGGAGFMSWVVSAYLLAEAVSTVLAGKFGDLLGRKVVFEVSLTVFAVGSVLCGLAQDMTTLIWARVIQGLGGGGLIVTAMALVADIIPLRYRGRYQGTLGAVFGITTMAGPTLGGILTDQLSWRWVFYINLPVTIVVLAIAVFAIPSMRAGARPVVDYAGIVLVALGSASLILAVSWAGDEYEWDSAVIIGLITTSVVLFVVFVQVELKAREPVLPMRLFRNSVFVVCSALSFIVGFAMLGAMTVLPTYLQYVDGMSATASGLRLLPMVAGVFTASTCSGKLVRRTGRYRIFPVTGTAVMTLGLWLMSTMSSGTGAWRMSAYLFVLGTGIGMTMQVLTIVVQNTATYTNLGTVSASMTYVRAMGGAFGAALFGTLFRDKLSSYAVIQNSGAPSPTELYERSAAEAAPIIEAYAGTISYVFVLVAPVALLGFLVTGFLKVVPLRDGARSHATDVGEGFSAPAPSDRAAQLERVISDTMRRAGHARTILAEILSNSGGRLNPSRAWAMGQTHLHARARGSADLIAIARSHRIPPEVLQPAFTDLCQAGYARIDGDSVQLTEAGQDQFDQVQHAWREWLDAHLEDFAMTSPGERALLDRALTDIATTLVNEPVLAGSPGRA